MGNELRDALQYIHDSFKRDMDAGYQTEGKEFAVAIAAEALAAQPVAASAAGLTDECIGQLYRQAQDQSTSGIAPSIYLARAIEREVLATQSAKQGAQAEPVAEVISAYGGTDEFSERILQYDAAAINKLPFGTKLYAAQVPPDVRDALKSAEQAVRALAIRIKDLPERTGEQEAYNEALEASIAAIRALMKSGSQSKGEGETQ